MSVSIDPPAAPRHQCINVTCGCDDLVSAGPCSEWCSANTVEAAEVERGSAEAGPGCGCTHAACDANRAIARGTPERGLA